MLCIVSEEIKVWGTASLVTSVTGNKATYNKPCINAESCKSRAIIPNVSPCDLLPIIAKQSLLENYFHFKINARL